MLPPSTRIRAVKRLTARIRSKNGPAVIVKDCSGSSDAVALSQTNRAAAIATFTAGPERATHNSWIGLVGSFSKRATPPIGSRMMSRVLMP